MSAMSPPIRTCTFIVPIRVVWKVAMSTNSCGTMVRRDAASISGLMCTRVCLLPVVQIDRALAGPECRHHGPTARLVAHVRAVGQVVGPELPHPQLVQERRLVAQAT
jgi:hypothetical protein